MKKEKIWVDSYYFPETYEVSNYGEVRNKHSKINKKLQGHFSRKGGSCKYWFVGLYRAKDKAVQRIGVHRLVYLSFFPTTPLNKCIHHINHISTDNRLSNLSAVDRNSHSSKHMKLNVKKNNWPLSKYLVKKGDNGKKCPSYEFDLIAIDSSNIIKHVISGVNDLISRGFSRGAYRVANNYQKTHRGLIFKKAYSGHSYKVGDIYEKKQNKNMITDKQRLDWLQQGHEIVALISKDGKGTVYTSNFVEQDWAEFESVRDAIDFGINYNKKLL